ncbi:MAG: hypothetical protein D6800_06265, partial [Candidatus Zixiibacteriota bacterium]
MKHLKIMHTRSHTFFLRQILAAVVFVAVTAGMAWADGPESRDPGDLRLSTWATGKPHKPRLTVNGAPLQPLAGDKDDLLLVMHNARQKWQLLAEVTPWKDLNEFGFYTDPGRGLARSAVFAGPDSVG